METQKPDQPSSPAPPLPFYPTPFPRPYEPPSNSMHSGGYMHASVVILFLFFILTAAIAGAVGFWLGHQEYDQERDQRFIACIIPGPTTIREPFCYGGRGLQRLDTLLPTKPEPTSIEPDAEEPDSRRPDAGDALDGG